MFSAGIERWGHAPDDEILFSTLSTWVVKNKLQGKRVIDFACGEGASGEILSKLGCIYHGVDIAPSAIKKTSTAIKQYPQAMVSLLDMVNDPITEKYDAAIDIMGLHMLILDTDRMKYLRKAFNCLKNDAPMLFFRQSHRVVAPEEKIETMEQWIHITGADYVTPQIRTANQNGLNIKLDLPLVPGRARTREGYLIEMKEAGFIIEDFIEMDINNQNPYSASILVRKPSVSFKEI